MGVYIKDWAFETKGKGTYEITDAVSESLMESGLTAGVVTVFLKHTSASLVLMENADPSARVDLERFLEHLIPENYSCFTHTLEGPDDMPSHIKMALTGTSENIPFANCRLQLGTWQGLFLWEHRKDPHFRKLNFTFLGE